MAEGLDFDKIEGGGDIYYWENIDENWVKSEIQGLVTRISNVSTLLDKVVYDNNFEKTDKEYGDLWMNDLGASGWVSYYVNTNSDNFEPFIRKNTYPSWYGTSTPEQKKNYDMARKVFAESSHVLKPMEELRKLMMLLPLKAAFTYMRITLNFDEAGLGEALYSRINKDMLGVSQVLNQSWDTFERTAYASQRFYNENGGKLSRSDMISGYRKARMRDYQTGLESLKLNASFDVRSDGSVSAKPDILAETQVIDMFTEKIASLSNIEDDMKKTMDDCAKLSATLNAAAKELSTPYFLSLLDALYHLKDKIYDYCEGGLNVYTCYKNHDDDQPYLFVKPLPAFGSIKSAYGFGPISGDPWKDGTQFNKLYRDAAYALSAHCREAVFNHGHPELR